MAALAAGCASEPAALEVGDAGFTEAELGALTQSQRHRLGLLTALALAVAERRLDELIQPLVLQQQDSLILERFLFEQAARASGLDETRLAAAYAADPDHRLTVRHLVVLAERWRDSARRVEAEDRARAALARIRGGEEFARVAAEVSEEPGAATTGGLLEPGRRGAWVPEFWDAAAALEVGEVSGVVETRYGYHVLQLVRRDTVAFDSVRYEALSRLREVVSVLPMVRQRMDRADRAATLRQARELGVSTTRAETEAMRADWSTRVAILATTFGFQAGGSVEEVKAAALEALGDPRQSVRIARAALPELAPGLEALYPIRVAAKASGEAAWQMRVNQPRHVSSETPKRLTSG